MSKDAEAHMPEIVLKAALQRGGLPHEVAEVGSFLGVGSGIVPHRRRHRRRRRMVGQVGLENVYSPFRSSE